MNNQHKLLQRAKVKHPQCQNWFGRRGTGSMRSYVCYICDEVIDTESARYAQTKHAQRAIASHCDYHLQEASEVQA